MPLDATADPFDAVGAGVGTLPTPNAAAPPPAAAPVVPVGAPAAPSSGSTQERIARGETVGWVENIGTPYESGVAPDGTLMVRPKGTTGPGVPKSSLQGAAPAGAPAPAGSAGPAPASADPFDSIGAGVGPVPGPSGAPSGTQAAASPAPSAPEGTANPFAPGGHASDIAQHAMMLGSDDVLGPAIGASLNHLLRPLIPGAAPATWGEDYARLQAEQRAARHKYETANPVTAAAAGVAGGLATPGVGQLFGTAAPGAGVIGQAANYGRNIAAGAGLGAAAGFGEAEGDLGARLEGAKTGAELGGAVSAAAPAVSAAVAGARNIARKLPLAEIVSRPAQEASVAKNIGRTPIETSPVGPLDLAQATGSPTIAAKARYAEGIPEGQAAANAMRTEQGAAVGTEIGNIGASSTAPDASAKFTGALRASRGVAGSEENRLWTVPKLANTKVSRDAVQQSVNSAVSALDPVLRDSMSPQLRALVNRVNAKGATTVRDLNGIRSDLERIARNSSDGAERSMARTLSNAFMDGLDATAEIAGAPNGVPTGRTTYARDALGILRPVPEISGPIVADPEITNAYQTARDYTRRMRTLFADPETAALLAKTESVYRVDPTEGARRFFNFSNGSVEGPQSIAELAAFIDSLRAQPGSGQVARDLLDSARSYVAATLSAASRLGEGQRFNPKTMQDFLRTNMPWIRSSGLFEPAQIEAADRLLDYAKMLRRTELLNAQGNSATSSRFETGKTFVDRVMAPWVRHLAEVTATLAGLTAHGEVGAAVAGGASAVFDKAVRGAEQAMREMMAGAVLDSRVAEDLQRRVSASSGRMLSPQTLALMQRIGSQLPAAAAAPVNAPSATPAGGAPQ